MNTVESAGPGIDEITWAQILNVSNDINSHLLWVTIIESVAKSVVEKTININDYSKDDIDEKETELIETWLDDAMPFNDHLADVLGELDYFSDIALSWDEKIDLSGEPCGYCADVILHLRDQLEYVPYAQEAITEDAVQSFYLFWRSRFLKQVLEAARDIN